MHKKAFVLLFEGTVSAGNRRRTEVYPGESFPCATRLHDVHAICCYRHVLYLEYFMYERLLSLKLYALFVKAVKAMPNNRYANWMGYDDRKLPAQVVIDGDNRRHLVEEAIQCKITKEMCLTNRTLIVSHFWEHRRKYPQGRIRTVSMHITFPNPAQELQ